MRSSDELDAPDLDGSLASDVAAWTASATSRQVAGRLLPGWVATWMCTHADPTGRGGLAARLNEVFTRLELPRSDGWAAGWAELVAAVALSIALLVGDLPEPIRAVVGEAPVEAALAAAGALFRFRVPVPDSVESQGVWDRRPPRASQRFLIGAPPPSTVGVDIESSEGWALSGPPIHDRAHTLLLALLRAGLLRDGHGMGHGPVAVVGAWGGDGRVAPVSRLAERARRWFEANPDALLITGPLDLDEHTGRDATARRIGRESVVPDGPWVAGASLDEIRAKLTTQTHELLAWDGELLGHVIPIPVSAQYGERPAEWQYRADPLFQAARAAAQGEKGRRGLLIDGGPGSGKSILSRTLVARFLRGSLSLLGFAVHCEARRLARRLDGGPASWATALAAESEHPLALLTGLEESSRLVPIVDGLDELQPAQLATVARWLGSGDGWWIATSRPLRGFGPEPPPSWRLTVEPVEKAAAAAFLRSRDRADLADAITAARADVPWDDLADTPLRLALLARTVKPGQSLADFDARSLYATAFDVQLQRGCDTGRMSEADARWLKQVVGRAVGEMALAWLDSADGALDGRGLEDAFERADMGLEHQERAVAALEEGRLLAPLGTHWEFAHRTIAEWAAAEALRRRVDRRCRGVEPRAAVQIERAVLDELGTHREPPGSSRWRTVLRFYAPMCRSPLALLDWLVGPSQIPRWRVEDRPRFDLALGRTEPAPVAKRRLRSSEALSEWAFAFDVLASCRWVSADEARTAWAIAVRRWLTEVDLEVGWSNEEWRASSLAVRVSRHLPHDWGLLARLVDRTAQQRGWRGRHPAVLFPAIPATHAALIWPSLESDEPAQVAAALAWSRQWDQPAPISHLTRLARTIPDRVTDVEAWSSVASTVWDALLDLDVEPPWPAVRARVGKVIDRRDNGVVRWFAAAPRTADSPLVEVLYRRRRCVLEPLLRAASDPLDQIAAQLAETPDSETRTALLAGVHDAVMRDKDDRHLWRVVSDVAERRGWPLPETKGAAKAGAAWDIIHPARRHWDRSIDLGWLVKELAPAAIDGILGTLWLDLAGDATARRVLIDALHHVSRLPDAIPPLLALSEGSRRYLDFDWTAAQRTVLEKAAAHGTAEERLLSLEALGPRDRPQAAVALLDLLPTDDLELDARIVSRFAGEWQYEGLLKARGLIETPPPTLADRARDEAPGWRDELMARLAEPAGADLSMLVELVEAHGIRCAWPRLVEHLREGASTYGLLATVARMATDDDAELLRPVVRHALAHHWPAGRGVHLAEGHDRPDAGEALARFLRIDDLEALADGEQDITRNPSLADALKALAPESTARLLAVHAERTATLDRMRAAHDAARTAARERGEGSYDYDASTDIWSARRRLVALAACTLASLDPATTRLARIVDVVAAVLVPDPERTYRSMPNSGVDEKFVSRALAAVEARLASHDTEWPDIEPMLAHPVGRLGVFAFEVLADHCPPARIIPLAIRALEFHLKVIDYPTQLREGGRYPPRLDSRLIAAIEARLSAVDSDELRAIAHHQAPAVRALAAKWANDVLAPRRRDWLLPLLTDPYVEVVEAAFDALLELAPDELAEALLKVDDERWSGMHDAMILRRCVGRPTQHVELGLERWVPRPPDVMTGACWTAAVEIRLAKAADREAISCRARRFDDGPCFEGFLGPVEVAVEAWRARLGERIQTLCRAWLTHSAPTVRAVARRLCLVGGDVHSIEHLRCWLDSSDPVDRLSAAECIVRQGESTLVEAAMAVYRGVLEQHPATEDRVAAGFDSQMPFRPAPDYTVYDEPATPNPPAPLGCYFEDRRRAVLGHCPHVEDRLQWALRTSIADFAPLLRFVAADIPFDNQEMVTTPVGDAIITDVNAAIEHWGVSGVAPLVRLFNEGKVENHPGFTSRVERIARGSDAGRRTLEALATSGNTTAREMLRSIARTDLEEDVTRLAALLEERVFPTGWRTRFTLDDGLG